VHDYIFVFLSAEVITRLVVLSGGCLITGKGGLYIYIDVYYNITQAYSVTKEIHSYVCACLSDINSKWKNAQQLKRCTSDTS
jgi:hypothetical protein